MDQFEAPSKIPDQVTKMVLDPAMQPTNEANLRQYINVFGRDGLEEQSNRLALQT